MDDHEEPSEHVSDLDQVGISPSSSHSLNLQMDKEESNKDTHFILVHGGSGGAWCWYKLMTLLESAGHRVTALDLAASGINFTPLNEVRSFSDYSQPLMDVLASIAPEEKAVLVGHSMGGLSLALAMEKFPKKISVAVFVTAVMPGQFYLIQEEDFKLGTMLVRPTKFFLDEVRKDAVIELVDKVYVVCKEDQAINEDLQRLMIQKSPVTEVKEIEGAGRMVMISKPMDLCNCLL